jgi:hypothetical protein
MSVSDKEPNEVEAIWENKSFRIRTYRTVVTLCVAAVLLAVVWVIKA